MSADIPNPRITTSAFGVEPGYAPYRLRQARYQALAEAVAAHAREHAGQPLHVLDVGMGSGRTLRYIEAQPGTERLKFSGVDIFPYGEDAIYNRDRWTVYHANLEEGLPFLDSQQFDIVLCEQVLEHMHTADEMLAEMERVLRPGGIMVLGVPIFPHCVAFIPRYFKPLLERLTTRPDKRRAATHGHVQAYSLKTFLRSIRRHTELEVQESRGFRIVSGGLLRYLENYRWWYEFNRQLGATIPSWCTETQVIVKKPAAAVVEKSEPMQRLRLRAA